MWWACYPKILESFDPFSLSSSELRRICQQPWCVTEKVHGANFSLIIEGEEVYAAKRSTLLLPGERFFDHDRLMPALSEPARMLSARLRAEDPSVEKVQLHGELCGGVYPHPEVTPIPEIGPIQTGVYYCPEIRWVIFDIYLSRASGGGFLPYDETCRWAASVNLFALPPLKIGPYAEVAAYSLPFPSTLPRQWGFPSLAEPNWAEGVVLKPMRSISLPTVKGPRRLIIKRKHPAFEEDKRYHQAQPWGTGIIDPDEFERWVTSMITLPRLHATISKLGRSTSQEVMNVTLAEDAWEDIEMRYGGYLSSLDSESAAWLQALLEEAASELVHRHYTATPSSRATT